MGFLFQKGNPKSLDSYVSLVACHDACLDIIAGQMQYVTLGASGVRDEQIVIFELRHDAVDALRSRTIDVYASTVLGNRILSARMQGLGLEAVVHEAASGRAHNSPVGVFSLSRDNVRLLNAVNEQLRIYLGSASHRVRMARYGLTDSELDPALICKRGSRSE
jgi:polar amino acid transport system substrate-binding protein